MSNYNQTAMNLTSTSTVEVLPTSGGATGGERQENESLLPAPSPAQSTLTVSVPLNQIATKTPQKRKRQSQSSPSTLSQTKRKKVTPKATPKGRRSRQKPSPGAPRRRNICGIENEEEEDDNSELSSGTDDRSVCEFSIHRLQVTKLQKVFKSGNPNRSFSENEIIEKFMEGVNDSKNYKERAKFVQKVPPNQDDDSTHDNEEPNFENQFHFKIVAYVQITQFPDPVLPHLGIELDAKVCNINKIVFYYRPNEIFAITFGQTWQVTQPYSCYDFPCIISGRLTRTDGNYQETRKVLTGIVKTARSTKKYSLSGDQLKSIQLNWTKEVRRNCSLYGLREFESESESKQTLPIRLEFGLACVRILKNMKLDNLPEILDHFAKIARRKPTFTFPKKKVEKQVDNFPQLRAVPPGETTEKLKKHLRSIVYDFLHGSSSSSHQLSQFDFCDKHIEDFFNLERLDIKYVTRSSKDTIKTFNFCPTTLQVFSAIRDGCAQLTKMNEKFSTFSNKLRNNLKVEYRVRGSCKTINRGLFALLEGEMRLDDEDQYYWKTMGQWFIIRDEYYYNVQKAFLDLLRKPDVLRIPSANVGLPDRWNFTTMKNVHDYVRSYESKQGFYLPPTEDELVKMGVSSLVRQSDDPADPGAEKDVKKRNLKASLTASATPQFFLFDLMYIRKQKDGKVSISIFYIFDRFDAGIRDVSIKIRKSVELLLKESPTASKKSLLHKFYTHYCRRDKFFNSLFPKFADFKNHMYKGDNVSIVVAFLTQGGSLSNEAGRIPEGRPTSPSRSPPPSFERERATSLHFNQDNVMLLVKNNLDENIINRMCMELKIPPTYMEEHDSTQLASKVLTLLMEKGYCAKNEGFDKPITGKLLKIRNPDNFQLFNDREVNREVFKGMSNNFISQFPGFVHKLECFEIYDSISTIPRLNLHFTEITAESQ